MHRLWCGSRGRNMSVSELREELKNLGWPTSGSREELLYSGDLFVDPKEPILTLPERP